MEAVFLFGLFILLLMLSVPIGYAIGMVTLVTMLHFTSMPTLMIAQNSIAGVDSFPLLAIPFFMLAGNLMSGGGIAKRLVNFFECFIGHITGGLGMVTIIVCMFFAAISGSAVATVSAVGAFMIPQMVEHGYSKPFSAALTAAAGTIGVIIPPSVPFVIYGVVSGASITSLFTAGFLPGILMGVALMIVCFIVSKKRGYRGSTEPPSASVIWVTFKDAIWAILSPVIILGGIYSGKFTPTEAAVISVVYSYVVGRFVYMEETMGIKFNALDVGTGSAERLAALMGDQVDVMVVNYLNVKDYIEKGDFVVYGVCAPERNPGMEKIPTFKEQGYDVVSSKIYEVKFPKGTDAAIVDKLSSAIEEITKDPSFKEELKKYYAVPYYRNAEQMNKNDKQTVEELKKYFKK